MLRFDIITIFPDFFGGVFDYGIVRRARAAGLAEVEAHDLRRWTHDKHKIVDDRPFGGGDDGAREHLVPLVASICVEVDPARRLIRVDAPEGLLEF